MTKIVKSANNKDSFSINNPLAIVFDRRSLQNCKTKGRVHARDLIILINRQFCQIQFVKMDKTVKGKACEEQGTGVY